MKQELLKQIIMANRRMAAQVSLIRRPVMWDQVNYVLVGMRQAGKSYLLYQRIQELLSEGHSAEEILYVNFDDERLIDMQAVELDNLLQAHYQLSEVQPIIFLDEIQNIAGWEHFARRLANEKYRVYITGSNAKMLSAEIATTLGGRYMVKEVYPYSFGEYLHAKRLEKLSEHWYYDPPVMSRVRREFEDYFYYGGFPESVNVLDKRNWLQSLYQKIFLGDIVMRYQLRNANALRLLIKKIAESVKQPSSYTRLANVVSSVGQKVQTNTIIDYISYAEDTWLLFSVTNYAARFAERESNKKYYFRDNGLLNLFLLDGATSLLENLVAIALKRRYGEGLYFYHKGIEVDFYLPEEEIAIQASYSLQDDNTRKREVDALLSLASHAELKQLLIITYAEEYTIEQKGRVVNVLPVWKWLLA